jgi:hypothetical protein
MKIRPVHLAVAALTVVAALGSAGTAQAASPSAADHAVSRYTAYQACQAAMWSWTAENAKIGTSVHSFRHHYRAKDVWRVRGGWHVQVGGARGEKLTANNDVEYCVVAGTNAQPKLIDYAYPR